MIYHCMKKQTYSVEPETKQTSTALFTHLLLKNSGFKVIDSLSKL